MHKIEFLQTNVSAKFKDGSCLEECVCQIDLGELDPSTHPKHKIEFLQTNVSARFKEGSCLEECVCQIKLGELDPSTHPNFVLKLTRAGRSDLYWTLDHARSPQRVARTRTDRTLACTSGTRHARSPQRVARTPDKSHSRLLFAHSTRTISAEGCAHTGPIALSPAFRALDTHDLRRGLHFRLTLFVPPSAFKRE